MLHILKSWIDPCKDAKIPELEEVTVKNLALLYTVVLTRFRPPYICHGWVLKAYK